MSKWRERGFVQDSDEDEGIIELYSEIPPSSSHVPHKRVASSPAEPISSPNDASRRNSKKYVEAIDETAVQGKTSAEKPQSPSSSTLTRTTDVTHPRRSESPDPIQHISTPLKRAEPKPSTVKIAATSEFLRKLLEDSSSDDLSEPPSDDDDPMHGSPAQRQAVQVVIPPSSTAVWQETFDAEAQQALLEKARTFRPRKPEQLHPYLIEQERYRQSLVKRGIRPLALSRSPPCRPRHKDTETQEQDFDPEDERPSNSPPDIVVSSPISPRVSRENFASRLRKEDEHLLPRTQPLARYSTGSKRQKLRHPPPQARTTLSDSLKARGITFGTGGAGFAIPRDDWAIPHSPPLSSSPQREGIARRLPVAITPLPNLPTPSNSSIAERSVPCADGSDSDIATPNTTRSSRHRPIILSESESGSDEDIRLFQKRVRGVLPASHVRYEAERLRQKALEEKARIRARLTRSSGRAEPQRGVAQRALKRHKSGNSMVTIDTQRAIEISDGSSEEEVARDTISYRPISGGENAMQEASALAAKFDSRYGEGDVSDMEYDLLDLAAGGSRTALGSKRQSKLTETFPKPKKPRPSDDEPKRAGASSRSTYFHSRAFGKRKGTRSCRAPYTPPPLSIIDVASSPKPDKPLPQFIRVAMRQARKRPDHGRHNPHQKHIRLHTLQDTTDALQTLDRWKTGSLKPQSTSTLRLKARRPLNDRVANEQMQHKPALGKLGIRERNEQLFASTASPSPEKGPETPSERPIFLRAATMRDPMPSLPASVEKKRPHALHRPPPAIRPAQIEGLETEYGRFRRKLQFQRGLQLVDQQFAFGSPLQERLSNLQLLRFLADEDTIPPPSPDQPRGRSSGNSEKPPLRPRRLNRKPRAQRLDVDAREYRQPSEPAAEDFLLADSASLDGNRSGDELLLQEPGPGGSYPITFDASPLPLGTYFHSSTFIGSGGLCTSFDVFRRDMDSFAGHLTIPTAEVDAQCGPWTDETYSHLYSFLNRTPSHVLNHVSGSGKETQIETQDIDRACEALQTLIKYISTHLSFLDTVDRDEFVTRMIPLLGTQFTEIVQGPAFSTFDTPSLDKADHARIRPLSYLLVLGMQIYQIALHPLVELSSRTEAEAFLVLVSKTIVQHLVRQGVTSLSHFLKRNMIFRERESGIRQIDVSVEATVICMHVLDRLTIPRNGFWDIVGRELSAMVEHTAQAKTLDAAWATAFTLLPFANLDDLGILSVNQRHNLANENWTFVKELLKRLFHLYANTKKKPFVNEYIRATLRRCHVLIETWHWRRCDPVLSTMFDFFAKHRLEDLQPEESKDSPRFLGQLEGQPCLDVEPGDSAFHIFLKCLASGLRGMRGIYTEKQMRSVVFRCTPNHGRNYPKDQAVEQAKLDALRNHHDLLCTLYWASPPSCRPKLDLIRGLVQHEGSHSKACRLNVRAWVNLTMFQLSVDEPYSSLQPFAAWHKDVMQQTLRQYRLAKTEADEYIAVMRTDGTSDISEVMVRRAMKANQEQILAPLRDCVAGVRRALQAHKSSPHIRDFLLDSGIVQLLECSQGDDDDLLSVIRDTLVIFTGYASYQKEPEGTNESQPKSNDSQDYGDFPDLDDLADIDEQPTTNRAPPPLEFIQTPLWHLLSNIFGAERPPNDDNFLMACVDAWVQIACSQVSAGDRSWSYYMESFSSVSWQQLRDTEQTRKYRPYFMAAILASDPSAYIERRLDFVSTLLVSLVDRESMLRFQHRLLQAMLRCEKHDPLLDNLPFYRGGESGEFDITLQTLKERRLGLISSILGNMQEHLWKVRSNDCDRFNETKSEYSALLHDMMVAMKYNYQQLRQGSNATGTYVQFVQQVVQFLTQYTSDICPVNPFFTDSVTFPLPASDPTYVVGRLCGYAPRLTTAGATKQLAVFMQTVTQQAAKDNHGEYLVGQLTKALIGADDRAINRSALRSVLLQGIFPAYIEAAFGERVGLLIAKPVLLSLKPIFKTLYFELRAMNAASVEYVCRSVWSVTRAFIKATEPLRDSPRLVQQPHVVTAMALLLDVCTTMLPILQYLSARITTTSLQKPAFVQHIQDLSLFVAQTLQGEPSPASAPPFELPYPAMPPHSDLLSFSTRDFQSQIKINWTESADGTISFGHGYARREVIIDMGTLEDEMWRFRRACRGFLDAVSWTYGDEEEKMGRGREAIVPGLYQLDSSAVGPFPAVVMDKGAVESEDETWEARSVDFSEGEEMGEVESSALF